MNLRNEYVLGSSLDIFGNFSAYWKFSHKRVFRNCTGFAKSNAKEILSRRCILSNAHCSSLTPLPDSFSLNLLGPVAFCSPLTWTRCAWASCPCVMWDCGSVPWHLRLLGSWIVSGLRFNLKKIPMRNSMKRPVCHYWALPLAAGAQGGLTILPPLSPRPRADLVKNRWSPFSHVAFLCQVEEAWNKVVDNLLFSSLQGLSGTEFHPKVWTFKSPLPWDMLVRSLKVGLLL